MQFDTTKMISFTGESCVSGSQPRQQLSLQGRIRKYVSRQTTTAEMHTCLWYNTPNNLYAHVIFQAIYTYALHAWDVEEEHPRELSDSVSDWWTNQTLLLLALSNCFLLTWLPWQRRIRNFKEGGDWYGREKAFPCSSSSCTDDLLRKGHAYSALPPAWITALAMKVCVAARQLVQLAETAAATSR